MTNKYQTIIDNFIRWGESSGKLYVAAIVGSQARMDRPADEYSDLDIIMVVDDPADFLSSDGWLYEIGQFYVSFVENTVNGDTERRVLFADALDVDFVLMPVDCIDALDGEALSILGRGYSILVDKIGFRNLLHQFDIAKQAYTSPSEKDIDNIVNDFWYHAVWTAKKIRRGELWTAKLCLDSYMKSKLLTIIECHAHAMHGESYDTWHAGRFIEKWADRWIIEKLPQCFSRYNEQELKAALLATMDLFRAIAMETAEKLNFTYPSDADRFATAWVVAALQ